MDRNIKIVRHPQRVCLPHRTMFQELKGRKQKQLHSQGFCNEHTELFFGGGEWGKLVADFHFPRVGGVWWGGSRKQTPAKTEGRV